MKPHKPGFTLIEMLVTFTIIATLGGLTFTGVRVAREKTRSVVEINAARNLITGYLGYAGENNGRVLEGYQPNPPPTANLDGELLEFPTNARYPWRLAASVPKIEGVMLFNGNERFLKQKNRDYLVSASPNLGLNATLVGGHFGSGSPLNPTPRLVDVYGKFFLSQLSDSDNPDKLIVFASARSEPGNPGYFEVRPPHLTAKVWASEPFTTDSKAPRYGFVDFRWGGKAVVAMLAGNVELLPEEKLRDMRRWSHQAARANDPDFMISRSK